MRKAAKSLRFATETETLLVPFALDGTDKLTATRVRDLAGAGTGTAVKWRGLDDVFRAVPPEDQPKFDRLAQALRDQLAGVTVYKVGSEAEKQASVVGKAADGRWVGLRTAVVET